MATAKITPAEQSQLDFLAALQHRDQLTAERDAATTRGQIERSWKRGERTYAPADWLEAGPREAMLTSLINHAEREARRLKDLQFTDCPSLAAALADVLSDALKLPAFAHPVAPESYEWDGITPTLHVVQRGLHEGNDADGYSGKLTLAFVRSEHHTDLDAQRIAAAMDKAGWKREGNHAPWVDEHRLQEDGSHVDLIGDLRIARGYALAVTVPAEVDPQGVLTNALNPVTDELNRVFGMGMTYADVISATIDGDKSTRGGRTITVGGKVRFDARKVNGLQLLGTLTGSAYRKAEGSRTPAGHVGTIDVRSAGKESDGYNDVAILVDVTVTAVSGTANVAKVSEPKATPKAAPRTDTTQHPGTRK